MRSKKAQLTVIIIVAIVIVAAIAGTTVVVTNNKKIAASNAYFAQADIQPTLEAIRAQIIDCSKDTGKDALSTIGVQGGYYKRQNQYFDLQSSFIPYYYYLGKYFQPSKVDVERELNLYISENLEKCLSEISYPDYQISHKPLNPDTRIKDSEVTFKINQQSEIEREGNTITLELADHAQTIPSELLAIINLADYITQSHKEDPELYCISCVSDIAQANDLFVDIVEFRENEMLVIISDAHSGEDPYSFEFLNKYTGNERTPELESIAAPNPNA